MRETFSDSIQDSRVTLSEGTFDHTGVESGWADLVVIAQVRLEGDLGRSCPTNIS